MASPSTPQTIPRDRLDAAAQATHILLQRSGFSHIFGGGYQLLMMGNTRGTKDVDVYVASSAAKVKKALRDDSEKFGVIDGTEKGEERGIRVLHKPSMVMIDVLFKNPLPSKKPIKLPSDINELPFFSSTYLFLCKVDCLAHRTKPNDENDLIWIADTCREVDWNKVAKKLKEEEEPLWEMVMKKDGNSSRLVEILASING